MAASSFSENTLGQIEGWIIDLYAKNDRMVIWLKTQDDEAVQLTDIWKRCFYVAGDYGDLIKLANQLCIEGMSYEEKFVKPNDSEPSSVLRIPVRSFRSRKNS